MAKFQVEWSTDHVEIIEQSDCKTVEQFMNCRFGAGKEVSTKVTLVDAEAKVEKAVKSTKK